jgi:hypothetical protein
MKTVKLIIIISMLLSLEVKAQISLVGASVNQSTSFIDIVKWHALDSASQTSYPTVLQGYYMASSVFDAFHSNYYLSGLNSTFNGLLSFNTLTNDTSLRPYSTFSNIMEIDMSTGKIYSLTSDSIGHINVNEYDINTGTDSLIGIIIEPGVLGIIVDAIGFDSNNGIIYYLGYDNTPANCLYSIPVRNPVFSWSKTTLQTSAYSNNFTSVNYDNVNNVIYAMNSEFDINGNHIGNKVVEINKITGEVITRGLLAGFDGFLAGSSSFDQTSGSLLLVGIDTSNVTSMIIFNTYNNTYQTGYVPGSVSEIVCDNYAFAKNAYGTTSVREKGKTGITLYSNPSSGKFMVSFDGSIYPDAGINIFDTFGNLVFEMKNPVNKTEIDLSDQPDGIYILRMTNKNEQYFQKIVIQK